MCFTCADRTIQRQLDETGINQVVSDMVREFDKTLTGAWVRESDEAIDESIEAFLAAQDNTTGYRAMLAVLTNKLRGVASPDEVKRMTVLTDGLYRITKEAEAAKLSSTFKMVDLDSGVIRGLSQDGPYWIGDFYGTHLSQRISEIGYNVTVDGGFGREAAGRTMKDALRQEFALSGGASNFDSMVPRGFAGNVDNYTRVVSSNVAQRARVYSSVSAMNDAGFKRFQFSAVMDERTSEICQEMNGRIFTVAAAVRTLNAVAAAGSPEDFKDGHPWPRNAEAVRATAGGGTFTEQNKSLEDSGISTPPLHGQCRSSIEAID